MDDDFNTPEAVAVLFDLAGEVNRAQSPRWRGAAARRWAARSACCSSAPRKLSCRPAAALDEGGDRRAIAARAAAKQARDFAEADRIRDDCWRRASCCKDSPHGHDLGRAAS